MPNTNCLKHIQCPSCGSEDRFRIAAKTIAVVTDDGVEDHGDMEWDDDSYAECAECLKAGTLRDFVRHPECSDSKAEEPGSLATAASAQALLLDLIRYERLSLADGDAEFDGVMYWFDDRQPDWTAVIEAIGWDVARAAVAKATAAIPQPEETPANLPIVTVSVRGGLIEDADATIPAVVVVEDWDVSDEDTGKKPTRNVWQLTGALSRSKAEKLRRVIAND